MDNKMLKKDKVELICLLKRPNIILSNFKIANKKIIKKMKKMTCLKKQKMGFKLKIYK